jgi:hypothetical protein
MRILNINADFSKNESDIEDNKKPRQPSGCGAARVKVVVA